jgi:ATP-dependent helicase/nuclease subunit B
MTRRAAGHLAVHTIAAGAPFLEVLADQLIGGNLIAAIGPEADPLALSRATIYVPSRRSARALEEAFARCSGERALLMPRILPLGDPAEIEERLPAFEGGIAPLIPEAAGDLDRRLELMRLIDQWRLTLSRARLKLADDEYFEVARSRADAFALAGDLANLIDEMIIERADWGRVPGLAGLELDRHWQLTAQFLAIAGSAWPARLEERGLIDAVARRQKLIEAETERLLRDRPDEVVIVAGSTGSQPATAELIRAVAALPNGAVILPGLDRDLVDDRSWSAIALEGPGLAAGLTHPQAGLKRLLHRMGLAREDVERLGPEPSAREKLFAAALRPAETTDDWLSAAPDAKMIDAALAGMSIVEASDERQEALAIAIAIRERLEQPEGTIAFITPDRVLAAHVIVELKRWGIEAQDSAGIPLPGSPAGRIARLLIDAAIADFSATSLAALLHDPLTRFGLEAHAMARFADAIETGILRGARIHGGLPSLHARCAFFATDRHSPRPALRIASILREEATMLVERLITLFAPARISARPLRDWALWHQQTIAACLLSPDPQDLRIEDVQGGPELSGVIDALAASDTAEGVDLATYRDFLEALMAGETARGREPVNSRVKILGPLEARLLPAECVILGGLNEGVWPPAARSDAFLNRSMRGEIGLSPPERRIGQSAHDFTMFVAAPELVLTRALRSGENPGQRSRFLERLHALTGTDVYERLVERGAPLLDLARRIDRPDQLHFIAAPAPAPPLERRPPKLSITEIETLIRDPYTIYARHVLGLDPLPPIDEPPDARLRGKIFHEAVAEVAAAFPGDWPADGVEQLRRAGFARIDAATDDPILKAFWKKQFEAAAEFLQGFETGRRAEGLHSKTEIGGRMDFALPGGSRLTVTGRADRIDRFDNGSIAIVDYKTGDLPDHKTVQGGFAPQLIITAIMARTGAFGADLIDADLQELLYIKLGFSAKAREVKHAGGETLEAMVTRLSAQYRSYIARFGDAGHGYMSQRRPAANQRFAGDYDQLARVTEWSSAGEERSAEE